LPPYDDLSSIMAERRYTDEEVAAIFERATETEHAALPAAEGKGMTLAALQEIGREAGISPESISAAARSLDTAGRLTSRTFMGFPVGSDGPSSSAGRSPTRNGNAWLPTCV
jgi:hypothetical protein